MPDKPKVSNPPKVFKPEWPHPTPQAAPKTAPAPKPKTK
jgi:hypothetical protein